ncbi:MAG: helicase, partial [Pedobacter sp.]
IKATTTKNFAVVAPTAVAAINAGGVTLHSFFQIPFGPLIPSQGAEPDVRYADDKIKLLKCLELLIIDEISMVRADIIDFIDRALKHVKGSALPFGGVQVLMIGDLYQLSPIFHDAWHVLKNYYASPYFFDSQILKKIALVTFELEHVYRQSDPVFLNILNDIRENKLSAELLKTLNENYDPTLSTSWKDEYVTLTTHNNLVTDINHECLEKLPGEFYNFKSVITGDFPRDAFPVDEVLQLKIGAQVMFMKNDSSGKKQYYNGKAAKITAIVNDIIYVHCIDDGMDLEVSPEIWQNIKYSLNTEDNKIKEQNTGSFQQYPFKLAWAITVHKSQGLTFDKAIVDISAAFTHGQAYVALSRCRSLDGLVLKSAVKAENIITDPKVVSFTANAVRQKPTADLLNVHRREFTYQLIYDLLDFSNIDQHWLALGKISFNEPIEFLAFQQIYTTAGEILQKDIVRVSRNFINQEISKLSKVLELNQQPEFRERLKKASQYFAPKIDAVIIELRKFSGIRLGINEDTDKALNGLNYILDGLTTKLNLFRISWDTFSIEQYNEAFNSASSHFSPLQHGLPVKKEQVKREIVNPGLYHQLTEWRKTVSKQREVSEQRVLSDLALQQIAEKLPRSTEQLAALKSIGAGNAVDLGSAILKLVNAHLGTSTLF